MMIINVCIICLPCSFGIRSHGPFSHLFLWGFLLYSGEEHFTFTSVQSPTGRLVFKALKLFHSVCFQSSLHWLFQKTPAQSRQLNKDCILLDFYDNHDVWHFLSASAMFCSFMVRHILRAWNLLLLMLQCPVTNIERLRSRMVYPAAAKKMCLLNLVNDCCAKCMS